MFYFETDKNNLINNIMIFDLLGRKILEEKIVTDQIDLFDLKKKRIFPTYYFKIGKSR